MILKKKFFLFQSQQCRVYKCFLPILSGAMLTFINLSWFHSINTNTAKTIQSLLLWNPKYVSLSLKVSLWSASLTILNGSFQRSKRKYSLFICLCVCMHRSKNILHTFHLLHGLQFSAGSAGEQKSKWSIWHSLCEEVTRPGNMWMECLKQ